MGNLRAAPGSSIFPRTFYKMIITLVNTVNILQGATEEGRYCDLRFAANFKIHCEVIVELKIF